MLRSARAGVWWRRPRGYLASSDIQESHLRQFAVREAREAFEGWLHCLGNRVINPLGAEHAAAHKLLQLRYAREIGLRIPRSVATNSPERTRDFCEQLSGKVVFKPFTGTNWQFVATQRLSTDALAHVDAVKYSPVIFQEEIRKIADLRVTIIDGQVFAAEIRSKRPQPALDWRVDRDCEYAVHELPDEIALRLRRLVSRLGLRFGACDLALTYDGEYVFFEVNTSGQWLFVEVETGLPLSAAFAAALLQPPPPNDAVGATGEVAATDW